MMFLLTFIFIGLFFCHVRFPSIVSTGGWRFVIGKGKVNKQTKGHDGTNGSSEAEGAAGKFPFKTLCTILLTSSLKSLVKIQYK